MLVFTHGLRSRPSATAFRATSPAPIITLGFDVLVQLVIAAMTTVPSVIVKRSPSYSTSASALMSKSTAVDIDGL